VDQCTDALNPGMQLDAALCNVPEVEGEVLVPPTPDGPDVLGEVIVRPAPAQLPRTGSPTAPLVAIGLLLIVAGAHVMRLGRERTAPI
jgi:LPXTG-motif cell wall-anchored protein